MMMKIISIFAIALLASIIGFTTIVSAHGERDTLAQTLSDMTKDLSCESDQQCKSYGFGHRPCGGYAAYKLYSTKNVNEDTLLENAERYAALARQHNNQNGIGSICSIEMPLQTACIQNECIEVRH